MIYADRDLPESFFEGGFSHRQHLPRVAHAPREHSAVINNSETVNSPSNNFVLSGTGGLSIGVSDRLIDFFVKAYYSEYRVRTTLTLNKLHQGTRSASDMPRPGNRASARAVVRSAVSGPAVGPHTRFVQQRRALHPFTSPIAYRRSPRFCHQTPRYQLHTSFKAITFDQS